MSVRGINPVPQFNGPAHLLDCAAPCFQRCVLILWPPDNVSVRLGKGSYFPLTRHFSANVELGEVRNTPACGTYSVHSPLDPTNGVKHCAPFQRPCRFHS